MSSRIFGSSVLVLSALAALQAAALVRKLRTEHRYHANLSLRPGAIIRTPVYAPSGERVRVSSIAFGSCALVVVYSPTCSASAAAARAWVAAERAESLAESLATTWRIVFVSVGDSTATASALPEDFPFQVFRAAKVGQLESEMGITAYPARFVLDREGRFVAGGVGAPVPKRTAFTGDCGLTAQEPSGGSPGGVADTGANQHSS